jgi:putative spermidine/putrescine transport system substrate-binding protein
MTIRCSSRAFLLVLVAAAVLLAACGPTTEPTSAPPPEPQVVVQTVVVTEEPQPSTLPDLSGVTLRVHYWGGKDGEILDQCVVQPFEKATGAKVVHEVGHTGQGVAKLMAQKEDPQLDMIMMDDVGAYAVEREGLLETLEMSRLPNAAYISPKLIGANGTAIGFGTYMLGVLYQEELVSPPPDSWAVVYDPTYKGKVGLEPPEWSGFLYTPLIATADMLGKDPFHMDEVWPKIGELKDQVHSFVEDPGIVSELFKSGEMEIAVTAPYVYKDFIEQGYPIGVATLKDPYAYGVTTLGIVSGHKAPEDAIYALMNYQLGVEAQACVMEHVWWAPTNNQVEIPDELAEYLLTPEKLENSLPRPLDYLGAVRDQWISKAHEMIN